MSQFESLTRFGRFVILWLGEVYLAWMLLATLAIALLFGFWPPPSEHSVRVSGWVLELCGLFTVAWGLRETRRQFGRPGIGFLVRAWWSRRPRLGGKVVTASATASLGAMSAAGRAYGWRNVTANATVEERVSALEANVKDVNDRVNTALRELDQEVRTRGEAVKTERSERQHAIQQVERKMEAVETGGLSLSAVGIVWLAVGLTLSTIPVELLALLK